VFEIIIAGGVIMRFTILHRAQPLRSQVYASRIFLDLRTDSFKVKYINIYQGCSQPK
jgi:hypothetical protein